MHVTFSCHCFTEGFSAEFHQDHHRYTYLGELRAFDPVRHECSLQLPAIIQKLLKGRVFDLGESWTYEAQIQLNSGPGVFVQYSIFFSLKKDKTIATPALVMYVKSAYQKSLGQMISATTKGQRFPSLAGQISGAFPPQSKPTRPQPKKKKKKAP